MTRPPLTARLVPAEFHIHCAVADLLGRCADKRWLWTHFPAGEKRDMLTGTRLQRMGLKPGWPDFILISPMGLPYFLELKSAKGDLSHEQQAFARTIRARGLEYSVARSVDQAIEILGGWGVVPLAVSDIIGKPERATP